MALVDILEKQGGVGNLNDKTGQQGCFIYIDRSQMNGANLALIKFFAASKMQPRSSSHSTTLALGHCGIYRPYAMKVRTLWAQDLEG